MITRKIRCPVCRKAPIRYVEFHSFYITFSVDENSNPDIDSGIGEPGIPDGVKARCKFGHYWVLRGVYQITDLLEGEK
jgi:hypothetical protein